MHLLWSKNRTRATSNTAVKQVFAKGKNPVTDNLHASNRLTAALLRFTLQADKRVQRVAFHLLACTVEVSSQEGLKLKDSQTITQSSKIDKDTLSPFPC